MPKFLGTKHMTRAEAVVHNTVFTKCFYMDKVTLIPDETYGYIQISADHTLQRSSYSGQKKRNLVKFMNVVFPDGYVLDTIDPFFGNTFIARGFQELKNIPKTSVNNKIIRLLKPSSKRINFLSDFGNKLRHN